MDAAAVAWAGVGMLFLTNIGSVALLLYRNGKSTARWQGQIETKIDDFLKHCGTSRDETREDIGSAHRRMDEHLGSH